MGILIFIIALTGMVIAKPLQESYLLGNIEALEVTPRTAERGLKA